MTQLLQSMVLTEIARVADLSTLQALRIANYLLDHGIRFAAQEVPTIHGIPAPLFETIRQSCLDGKRIQAIKELRTWAIDTGGKNAEGGAKHPLGHLRGAKDFIDLYFPPVPVPGQS